MQLCSKEGALHYVALSVPLRSQLRSVRPTVLPKQPLVSTISRLLTLTNPETRVIRHQRESLHDSVFTAIVFTVLIANVKEKRGGEAMSDA